MALVRMSRQLVGQVADNALRVFQKNAKEPPAPDYEPEIKACLDAWLETKMIKLAEKVASVLSPEDAAHLVTKERVINFWIDYNTYDVTKYGVVIHRFRHLNDRASLPDGHPALLAFRVKQKDHGAAIRAHNEAIYKKREEIYNLLNAYPSMNKFLAAHPTMKDLVPDHVLERIRQPSSRAKTGTQLSEEQSALIANLRVTLVADKLKGSV